MGENITLDEFIIENQFSFPFSTGELSILLNGITATFKSWF